jgi:hypothetical protein
MLFADGRNTHGRPMSIAAGANGKVEREESERRRLDLLAKDDIYR